MRLLVCGSRSWAKPERVAEVLDFHNIGDLEIVCGYDPQRQYPPGPDKLAYEWAIANKVAYKLFPYLYHLGRAGGYTRNAQMLDYITGIQLESTKVLAFWDGRSRGTKNMIEIARRAGVPVEVVVQT